ncbi:MAG: hypothetical protein GY810_14765 [Aureispira sp.]|nr:hypothetical protein [Aureispira sp.]
MSNLKSNCENCKHLEWHDSDCYTGFGSGFTCIKREDDMYKKGKEDELLGNLMKDSYRNHPKRCFEAKTTK